MPMSLDHNVLQGVGYEHYDSGYDPHLFAIHSNFSRISSNKLEKTNCDDAIGILENVILAESIYKHSIQQ